MKHTSGMTIINKVSLLLLGVVALPLVLSLSSAFLLARNALRFEKVLSEDLAVFSACQEMRTQALVMRMSLREYIATLNRWDERQVFRRDFDKAAQAIRKSHEKLKTVLPAVSYGPDSLQGLEEGMMAFEGYYQSAQMNMDELEEWTTIDYEQANGRVNDFKDHIYDFEVPVEALSAKSRRALDERVLQLKRAGRGWSYAVFVVLAVSLAGSFVMTLLFLARLRKDLNQIISQVKEIAAGEGDLTRSITINKKDEMGALAGHVNTFIGSLRSLVIRIKEITERSLTLSADLAQISSHSAASLETVRGKSLAILRTADDLDRDLESMVAVFEKVGAFSSGLDMMIDSQASSINESSAAIEQMSASIINIGKSTEVRTRQATALRELAGTGETRMEQTIAGIRRISDSARAIMEMLTVIDGIASQTNLLAMNAAIEAAHAGEAGRGFSVVAEEIRKLSEETAENSAVINNKLREIAGQIEESALASRETGEHFRTIVEEVGIMTDSFADMNRTMNEMSGGTRQVTEALTSLVSESEEIRRSSAEIRSEISGLGTSLKNISALSGGTRTGIETITAEIEALFRSLERLDNAGRANAAGIQAMEELINRFRTETETETPDGTS